MLCDQLLQSAFIWCQQLSVCGTASDLPNLACSHNQRKYFFYVHLTTSSHMVSTQHYDALASVSSCFISDQNFGVPDIKNVMNNVFGSERSRKK